MSPRGGVALAAAVTAMLVPVACGESDEPLEVSNDVYKVEIPAGYEELDGGAQDATEDAVDAQLDEQLGGDVSLDLSNAWAKDPEDGFATNINVATEQIPDGMDLDEYRRITLDNAAAVGIEIERDGESTTLGGEPALLFEGTQSPQDDLVRSQIISVIHDGVSYSLTLTALDDRFDDEVGAFEDTIATWTWLD